MWVYVFLYVCTYTYGARKRMLLCVKLEMSVFVPPSRLELNPWDSYDRRIELTSTCCPLVSTHVPYNGTYPSTQNIYTQIHELKR